MEEASPFKMVAGHVALDFANTLDNRYHPGRAVDLVPTYEDLIRFCLQAGAITLVQANRLARLGRGTDAAMRKASELREALERIFVAIIRKGPVPADDLAIVTDSVKEAMEHRVLQAQSDKLVWQWTGLDENASGPLWPIAEAAAGLLVSNNVKLVRECGIETCRWLFLDVSKNHSRRWCDMKVCGNRIKARNYYQKIRGEKVLT